MKDVTERDGKLVETLGDIQHILSEEGEIEFFEAIDLAGRIVEYIDNHYEPKKYE